MISPTKQKILLLLLAGVAFGFAYTLGRQRKILKELGREWQKIDEKKIKDEIRQLYQSRMIQRKENSDGSETLLLTKKGKLKALTFHFEHLKIKKENWDGKWRLVIFDIPEKIRAGRNALRRKLRDLGFYELQKSALIFPYACEKELKFIIEFFGMRRFVRVCIVQSIDNEPHLKRVFGL
ncbi:MAG: hypothetical protein Q7S62_00420 [bacterium]|nr:hypothetical protein [bacterium]